MKRLVCFAVGSLRHGSSKVYALESPDYVDSEERLGMRCSCMAEEI